MEYKSGTSNLQDRQESFLFYVFIDHFVVQVKQSLDRRDCVSVRTITFELTFDLDIWQAGST